MQKNLWICLIFQKNRWLKYRFFALFRRVHQKAGARSKRPVCVVRNPCARTRAWRETRVHAATLALAPGEKPARSERMDPAWRVMRSMSAREHRSPKVISASVDLLHKIFTYRKDELVKDLPAT